MNVVIDVTEIGVREILMVNDPFYFFFFFISILSLKIENLSRLNEKKMKWIERKTRVVLQFRSRSCVPFFLSLSSSDSLEMTERF